MSDQTKNIQHFNRICGGMSMVPGRPTDIQNLQSIEESSGLYQQCWSCIKQNCNNEDECDISSCWKLTPQMLEQEMKKFSKQ